jgi:DNA polymerase/3'-5' exonuclease PolX
MIAEGRLTEIPGVGETIADIITKLHRTGSHPSLEKLRNEIPLGVIEMLTVPGLRPEKVLRLHKDLGITSLAELEAAAREDRIRKANGLGASLQKQRSCRTSRSPRAAKADCICIAPPPYSNMRRCPLQRCAPT